MAGAMEDDGGLSECAEEYLLRHRGFGAAEPGQEIVGLSLPAEALHLSASRPGSHHDAHHMW
jgi:hypothetical protein